LGTDVREAPLPPRRPARAGRREPDYENYSNEFRRNVQGLMKNTKDENLDGCALSYVKLALTCVKCHKYVRELRMDRLPSLLRQPLLGER